MEKYKMNLYDNNIIPLKDDLLENSVKGSELSQPDLTETQLTALRLYDLDLNVFPVKFKSKMGYSGWDSLDYARLSRNGKNGRYSLTQLTEGLCNLALMNGRTSGNLCCLDCETFEAFQYHKEQFRRAGIPLWTVKSGRGGHIYFRLSSGLLKDIKPGIVPDVELRCSGYQLIPPSIHPDTTRQYEWDVLQNIAPPVVDFHKINWLMDSKNNSVHLQVRTYKQKDLRDTSSQITERLHSVSQRTGLPFDDRLNRLFRKTVDYLENGHQIQAGLRNDALFNAACDMAACGYRREEANVLAEIAIQSGLRAIEVNRTIDSAYSQERTTPKLSFEAYHQKPILVRYAQLWVDNEMQQWQDKRTFPTDFKVAIALLHRAERDISQNGVFRASQREVAQIARVRGETACHAIKRLIYEYKFIRYVSDQSGQIIKDDKSGSYLYAFQNKIIGIGKTNFKRNLIMKATDDADTNFSENGTLEGTPLGWSDVVYRYLKTLDASERTALGVSGIKVYETILKLEEEGTARSIAEKAGLLKPNGSYSNVYHILDKLLKFGLIQKNTKGYLPVVVNWQNLDSKIDEKVEIKGKGEKRKQIFNRERELRNSQRLMKARMHSDSKHKTG
jgi:hypothetical protein